MHASTGFCCELLVQRSCDVRHIVCNVPVLAHVQAPPRRSWAAAEMQSDDLHDDLGQDLGTRS